MLVSDPSWGVVVSALHAAESHGWPPEQLLAAVVPARELRTAGSLGAVIAWRIDAHIAERPAPLPLDPPTDIDLHRYQALLAAIPALASTRLDLRVAAGAPPVFTSYHRSRRRPNTAPQVPRRILAAHAVTVAAAAGADEAQIFRHRAWPHLAAALIAADQAGHDTARLLAQACDTARNSPGDWISQLARATRRLLHARGIDPSSCPLPASLRYAQIVTAVLGSQAAERARSQPAWRALEAALRRAQQAGHDPAALLAEAAHSDEPVTSRSLSETLAWRIGNRLLGAPEAVIDLGRGDREHRAIGAWRTLAWMLKAAENDGAHAEDILAQAARAPDLATVLDIASQAAVQHRARTASASGLPPWVSRQPPAPDAGGDLGRYLTDAAALIAERIRDLALDAAHHRPAWTSGLGAPPAGPRSSAEWLRHLGIIAAYRDQYQIPTDDPHQILGPYAEPGHAGHHAYWHAVDSILAARRLTRLEPADTIGPAQAQVRSQMAADIYLALAPEERAAIQATMISRLGHAWFGAPDQPDDHAVTRPAYGPWLAAILTERGHLTITPAGHDPTTGNEHVPQQPVRPIEAALRQSNRRGGSAGLKPSQRAKQARRRWPPQPTVPPQSRRPAKPVPEIPPSLATQQPGQGIIP